MTRLPRELVIGHHDDLLEARVHANKLGDAIAHAGRRQIDDARVEGVAIVQAFPDAIINGNAAYWGCKNLSLTAWRGSKHDIAARKRVAHRRH